MRVNRNSSHPLTAREYLPHPPHTSTSPTHPPTHNSSCAAHTPTSPTYPPHSHPYLPLIPLTPPPPPRVELTYRLTVYTGDVFGAGTDANVYAKLTGEHGDSGDRQLSKSESHTNKFERKQVLAKRNLVTFVT